MKSLAGQKTHFLTDEWIRLRRFLKTGRTQTVRDHAAEIMLRIEKELEARKTKTRRALEDLAMLDRDLL